MKITLYIGYIVYQDSLKDAIVNYCVEWDEFDYKSDSIPDLSSIPVTSNIAYIFMTINDIVIDSIDNHEYLDQIKKKSQHRLTEFIFRRNIIYGNKNAPATI